MKETFISKLRELWAIRKHLKTMQPSVKAEALEKELIKLTGIDRRKAILANVCVPAPVGCGSPVTRESFRDQASIKEYTVSGLCQKCQDKIFG